MKLKRTKKLLATLDASSPKTVNNFKAFYNPSNRLYFVEHTTVIGKDPYISFVTTCFSDLEDYLNQLKSELGA